jgi:hypothetical protein
MTATVTRRAGSPYIHALDRLPTVGLDEVVRDASLQRRVDRKYLMSAPMVPTVLGAVDGPFQVVRIDGRRVFGYRSVYFDTPELDAFYRAGQGRRRRFKVRTRQYTDSGATWLEVKTRGPRGTTVKTRTPYHVHDTKRLTDEGRRFVDTTLAYHDVHGVDVTDLLPSLETTYRRSTLLVPAPGGASRATIDSDIVWRLPGDDHSVTPPGLVIVETKGGAHPSALDRALWSLGIRPATISKYGTGLAALTDDLPPLKWHRSLTRTRISTD